MRKLPPLSPHQREVLLDALRPPQGHYLDCAVGTSYSLDLMSALLVPMAFAMFDGESEEGAADPVALLAATQAYASRVTLYCEKGRIAPAAKAPNVLAYLEESLAQVEAPVKGAFHPKLWVLRYHSDTSGMPMHRVLCMSRNLTFDRSWDTILRLEQGDPVERQTNPLVRFLRTLNEFADSSHARSLAKSLTKVSFQPPPGFERLSFEPMLPGTRSDPLGGGDELFVAAPFMTSSRLKKLSRSWNRVTVASRGDTLDRLPTESLERLHQAFAFDGLEPESTSIAPVDEAMATTTGLQGLHAKIHSGQTGAGSFLLVGSANCTEAAFGRNVEFCVRLEAKDGRVGPKALLRERDDRAGLRDLLQEYAPPEQPTGPTEQELELERLEGLRREVALRGLRAACRRRKDGTFDLTLSSTQPMPSLGKGDHLKCWPITLVEPHAERVGTARKLATWHIQSLVNVTGLIAFELSGARRDVPPVRFTIKAELVGDIEGRLDAVLSDTLSNPERLIRFLLLLLAAGSDDNPFGSSDGGTTGAGGSPLGTDADLQIPLLETLLRTFARDPGRLRAFQRAVAQIESARNRGNALPASLIEVWAPVEAALGTTREPEMKR